MRGCTARLARWDAPLPPVDPLRAGALPRAPHKQARIMPHLHNPLKEAWAMPELNTGSSSAVPRSRRGSETRQRTLTINVRVTAEEAATLAAAADIAGLPGTA